MFRPAARCITEAVPDVSVFLAISDPLQRALLVRALRRHGDLTVVGTEQDGCRALDAIVRDGPDVAVIEAGLPTLDGLALCRRLAQARPEVGTRVLLLDDGTPVTRDRAVASGAAGCVPATATSAQLCDAVASIANGGTIFYN
jgi:two-component system, LuxR family, secretion system response regulator SsrB